MTTGVVMRLQHRVNEQTLRELGFSSLENSLLLGEEFTLTEWWSWKKQTQTLPEADKDRTWVTDNMLQDGTFQLGMKKFLP